MVVQIPEDLLSTQRWNELNLHVDNNDAATDTDAYAAMLTYRDENDSIIARTAADAAHNHWGVYTRANPLSDPSGARIKRLNVAGGSENTNIIAYGGDSADARFRINTNGTGSPIIDYDSGGNRVVQYLNDEKNTWRADDLARRTRLFRYHLGQIPRLNIESNPVSGLREIKEPTSEKMFAQEWAWDKTDNRWLYKDSNEEVHWFRPCGTLD